MFVKEYRQQKKSLPCIPLLNARLWLFKALPWMLLPFFISGCGAPPSSGGAEPTMGMPPKPGMPQMTAPEKPGASVMPPMPNKPLVSKENIPSPPSGKDSPLANFVSNVANTLKHGDGDSVSVDGFVLKLASNIITAGTNPFLNRLNHPKTQDISTIPILPTDPNSAMPGNPVPELPPADPLEKATLTGVMYNKNTPMALMMLGSEQSSRMVKVGEKIAVDATHSFQVLAIKPDSIELKAPGKKEKSRILKISSIIGASNPNATQNAAYNTYTNPGGALPGMAGRNSSDLSNLSKLMDLTNQSP